ncbi:MAG TPA: YggS family pyridoxal phosphate-dependent enzyme [Bacteroidota bacterium]|nr:YggS family pyridoxal phosphate-dependent enzyme [Bacteroidota bacterium]
MLTENAEIVRKRIRDACTRCGRNPDDVLLLAVSKTFGVERIREALDAGLFDFGENYAQEFVSKCAHLQDSRIRWHFIGHLQSNKVKYIAGHVSLIHSLENLSLAEELQKRGEKLGRTFDVLVEVHTTDEATKTGLAPGKTLEFVKTIAHFDRVHVQGLMTMGPFSDDPEDSRPSFRQLKDLRDRITREGIANVAMRHLSMGMSHDYGVAIEEGSTIVRIGTAIFGERMYRD